MKQLNLFTDVEQILSEEERKEAHQAMLDKLWEESILANELSEEEIEAIAYDGDDFFC